METRVILSTIVLVFSTFVSSSQGIQCFVCNSEYQKGCDGVVVPDRYKTQCTRETALPLESGTPHGSDRAVTPQIPINATFTFCRKNVVTIPNQNNGDYAKTGVTRVIRSCGFLDSGRKDACKWAAASGIQLYMCECNSDGCNSASTTIPAIVSLVLLAVGAFSLN